MQKYRCTNLCPEIVCNFPGPSPYNHSTDSFYYGQTGNLKRRLAEHNKENNTFTNQAADWRLAYYEAYRSKKDAKDRERKIKQHGSTKGHLKARISDSINKLK